MSEYERYVQDEYDGSNADKIMTPEQFEENERYTLRKLAAEAAEAAEARRAATDTAN